MFRSMTLLTQNNSRRLESALERQIKPVNAAIIISGMYVHYRRWIQHEVDVAIRYNKQIIGVIPRGHSNIPSEVTSAANTIVHWNTKSIVSAIREHSL